MPHKNTFAALAITTALCATAAFADTTKNENTVTTNIYDKMCTSLSDNGTPYIDPKIGNIIAKPCSGKDNEIEVCESISDNGTPDIDPKIGIVYHPCDPK